MRGIDAHHGEGFARAGLTVCKDSAVITLKAVDSAFLANLEEHILLSVVISNRVKGEFFILIARKGLNGVSMVFNIDTDAVVLLFLSGLGEGYF